FLSSQKLTGIKYYYEGRAWHGGLDSGCETDHTSTMTKNVSYGVTEYNLPDFNSEYDLRGTLRIFPLLHIEDPGFNPSTSILSTKDKVIIKSDTGFLSTEY